MEGDVKTYAVMIDLDGEWMYLPEDPKCFKNYPEPRLFYTITDAEYEASKWNTGIVVQYKEKKNG